MSPTGFASGLMGVMLLAFAGGRSAGQPPAGAPPTREAVLALLSSDADEAWRERPKLAAHGKAAFPVFDALLEDPKTRVLHRCRVFDVLGVIEGDRSRYVQPALRSLTHDSWLVRWSALKLLDQIGSPEVTGPVVALLFDDETAVVNKAATTLAKIGGSNDLIALDAYLRSAAVRGLHPAFLAEIRKDRNDLVKRLAARPLPPAP